MSTGIGSPWIFGGAQRGPLGIGGLAAWYDANKITGVANGAQFGTWNDISGNNRHATQSVGYRQPVYYTNIKKGNPAVYFNGGNYGFEGTGGLDLFNKDFSIFTVINQTAAGEAIIIGAASGESKYWGGYYTGLSMRGSCLALWNCVGSGLQLTSSYNIVNQWLIAGGVKSNSTTSSVYINNAIQTSSTTDGPSGSYYWTQIGHSCDSTPYASWDAAEAIKFTGYIAEIVVYYKALSQTEVDALYLYFQQKYF